MGKRAHCLASLGAVAFGLLALFSGLDRVSEHQPSAVRLVPEFMRANANRVLAAQALVDHNPAQAAALAVKAIEADPLDPRGSGFLAAALLAEGDASAAHTAFAVSDALGMREPLIQAYMFDRALAAKDFVGAARRLNILLRAHPSMTSLDYFFSALEADDRGRLELVRWLSQDPLWAAAYLEALGDSDEILRSRARFLASVAEEVELGCSRIEPMMRELTERNYRAEAQQLSVAQCPQHSIGQLLADPGFEAVGSDALFGWRRHMSGDVRVSLVGTRDKVVEVDNRAVVTRLVLSQPVAIGAGEFRIFASVSGPGSDRVLASLDCGEPERPSNAGASLGRGQLVQVPVCPDHILGIWVRPGDGAVRIDNIRLQPVGR